MATPIAVAANVREYVTTRDKTATPTATADSALTYYMNFSVTWSASSASNTITVKSVKVEEMN